MTFWIKREATIHDVAVITNEYQNPVGVEWQESSENGPTEMMGITVYYPCRRSPKKIILVDPFWYYSGSDRIFTTDLFVTRWWIHH